MALGSVRRSHSGLHPRCPPPGASVVRGKPTVQGTCYCRAPKQRSPCATASAAARVRSIRNPDPPSTRTDRSMSILAACGSANRPTHAKSLPTRTGRTQCTAGLLAPSRYKCGGGSARARSRPASGGRGDRVGHCRWWGVTPVDAVERVGWTTRTFGDAGLGRNVPISRSSGVWLTAETLVLAASGFCPGWVLDRSRDSSTTVERDYRITSIRFASAPPSIVS